MSTSAELADQFNALNQSLISFVERAPEHDWHHVVPGEEWPVSGTVRHIAAGYVQGQTWIKGFLDGKPIPIDQEEIDRHNAARAHEFAATTKAKARDMLVTDGADVSRLIRTLTAEQLAISHPVLSGRELTTKQLVKILIRHTQGHFDNARTALGHI